MAYWRQNPPTHILMKASVDFKAPEEPEKKEVQDATELAMMFGLDLNAGTTGVLHG